MKRFGAKQSVAEFKKATGEKPTLLFALGVFPVFATAAMMATFEETKERTLDGGYEGLVLPPKSCGAFYPAVSAMPEADHVMYHNAMVRVLALRGAPTAFHCTDQIYMDNWLITNTIPADVLNVLTQDAEDLRRVLK